MKMKLLTSPKISPEDKCPYISSEMESHEYFFADEIKKDEMDFLLAKGWRKFGHFLFRPQCLNCHKCIPLRVLVQQYKKSKSQRRIANRNSDIKTRFGKLQFKDAHFELYYKHSRVRFNKNDIQSREDFIQTFYIGTGKQVLSEFYLEDKLIAFGILDEGVNSLSSVYFVFDTDYEKRNLGTFGAMKEIEYALANNLQYYYLGYWIEENKSMKYKNSFKKHQLYNWNDKQWREAQSE